MRTKGYSGIHQYIDEGRNAAQGRAKRRTQRHIDPSVEALQAQYRAQGFRLSKAEARALLQTTRSNISAMGERYGY